jgi:hypothetical protein
MIDEPFPSDPFPPVAMPVLGNSGPQQLCVANNASSCPLTGANGSPNPYMGAKNNIERGHHGAWRRCVLILISSACRSIRRARI